MNNHKDILESKIAIFALGIAIVSTLFIWHNALAAPKHAGGLLPDDPAQVEKIPLILSRDHVQKQMDHAHKGILGASQVSRRSSTSTTSTRRDRTAPLVSITSPASGSTVSGSVNIQMSASDNIGVVQVVLNVDGVNLASFASGPYSYSLSTSSLSAGSHTIKATALDAAGNSASSSITLKIQSMVSSVDSTPPVVSITSPADGASFEAGAAINVAVNATDNTGIGYVRFLVDGVSKAIGYVTPYSYSIAGGTLSAGTHTLTVNAYDGYNNMGSTSIAIVVNAVILPPPPVFPASQILMTPPAQNQGGEGACSAFASTYARSIEYFYQSNALFYDNGINVFSPEFVYDQIKAISDCGGGSTISAALALFQSTGVVTWNSMPYSSWNGCALVPTQAQWLEALNYRISGSARILTSDMVAVKSMLMNHHPVLIGAAVDQAFLDARAGFIWTTYQGGGVGHALTIVGFDDSKHAYKVLNSWGTAWGDQGSSWIDYDLLPTVAAYYSYVINN